MFVRIWELVFPIWRFFRSQNISWRSAEIVRVAITIVLLQSPTAYFITKCDGLFMYYKVRQFYYKLHQVLECATKCEEHSINGLLTYLSRTYILHTAISRKVFGKSARDNTERYCRWSWVHCYLKKFERMVKIRWNSESCDYYSVIAKSDSLFYYKVWWSVHVLQSATILLQITSGIRMCDKVRRTLHKWIINLLVSYIYSSYSYFEKGFRKKCTRQYRKVL